MRRDAQHKELAMERIEKLFSLASGCFTEDPQLANRYVELARNIGMRCQVRIPAPLKMRFCRRCGAFLTSGSNSRVRIRPDGRGRVVVTCLKCGTIKRYPMIREKLQNRENVTC
jgi:ribonuclease P protein subunit RPR2